MKWFISICLFLTASFLIADDLVWEWQNPKPQGNTLYDVAVLDENTMIAVGENGTVVRTQDGGETWDVRHYVCGITGAFGWNKSGVHFNDNQTGWISIDSSLIVTENGGDTWSRIELPDQMEIFYMNQDTIYGIGSDNDGPSLLYLLFYKSYDNCATWHIDTLHEASMASGGMGDAHFTDSQTGYIALGGYGRNWIMSTKDGGLNWSIYKFDDFEYSCLIDFYDSEHGLGLNVFPVAVVHTKNGGANWEVIYESINIDFKDISYPSLNIAYALTENSVMTIENSGLNWSTSTENFNTSLYGIDFYDNNYGWVVGNNGAMFKTTDGGQTWQNMQEISITTSLNDIFFIDENVGWVVGKGGSIYKTSNGGDDWVLQESGTTSQLYSVIFTSPDSGWAVGGRDILSTNNGGNQWDIQKSEQFLHDAYFVNSSHGWALGYNGYIVHTSDGGISWTNQTSPYNTHLSCIHFVNDSIGWAAGKFIAYTTNGGYLWEVQEDYDSNRLYQCAYFLNNLEGWLAGDDGLIKHTIDGGVKWDKQESHSSDQIFEIQFINRDIGYCTSNSILATKNAGEEWESIETPFSGFRSLYFINQDLGWAVGGRNIIRTKKVINSIDQSKKYSPIEIQLYHNYPNPFNPTTIIEYNLLQNAHIKLSIYNIKGQLIETLVNTYQMAGYYKLNWHAESLPGGIYFYQLKTNTSIDTKKMLLIR